jgi:transposase
MVARLAPQISTLDAEIADVDAQTTGLFRRHESTDVLLSKPGFGPVLAATFLANIDGNLDAFDSVERLAIAAGLAPVPRGPTPAISKKLRSHRPGRAPTELSARSAVRNALSPRAVIFDETKRKGGCGNKVARNEKADPRFCDYYSFMSYSDFTAWLEAADGTIPEMSFSEAAIPA